MAAWQMPTHRRHATLTVVIMEPHMNRPRARFKTKAQRQRWLEAMYDVETYFNEYGCSDFEYDEELDVFRFPEDGRFAFCKEFADWKRLWQRGYLTF